MRAKRYRHEFFDAIAMPRSKTCQTTSLPLERNVKTAIIPIDAIISKTSDPLVVGIAAGADEIVGTTRQLGWTLLATLLTVTLPDALVKLAGFPMQL